MVEVSGRSRRTCIAEERKCSKSFIAAIVASYLLSGTAHTYEFEALYSGDVWSNVSGGLEEGSTYLDNLDISYQANLNEDFGFGFGSVLLRGLYNNNATFSEPFVGDSQTISNIDSLGAWRLFEALYIYEHPDGSVLGGLYDLNSEFDVNNVGAFFLHSSHGIGAEIAQSGQNGPGIFPVSALTLRYEHRWDRIQTRVAVLDGVPGNPNDGTSNRIDVSLGEGLLGIAELDYSPAANTRLWGGVWYYTQESDVPFDGFEAAADHNQGAYVALETELGHANLSRRLFIRYGVADADLNAFDAYLGLGLVLGRHRDGSSIGSEYGIAVAAARTGETYRDHLESGGERSADWEIGIEMSYRAQVSNWLAIQPDIQYVINPSGNKNIADALIIGVRFEFDIRKLFDKSRQPG